MKSCKFPCTLAAFLWLGFWRAPLLARSPASATQAQSKPEDSVTAAGDGPIRFAFQAIDFKPDSCETPEGGRSALRDVAGDRVIIVKEPAR